MAAPQIGISKSIFIYSFDRNLDHLEGIESIYRHDAAVREFPDKEALMSFLQEIKRGDATRYKQSD